MARFRSAGAPLAFAARRLRARPLSSLALVVALAAAAGLVSWSSLTAATSQEQSVRDRLESLPPGERSLEVVYFNVATETDVRAPAISDAFAAFHDVTKPAHRIQISHSIVPGDPLGMRIVVPDDARADVAVHEGRLPRDCDGTLCEVLALKDEARIGARVRLGPSVSAVVVGRGSLRTGLLRDRSELGREAVLVRSLAPQLRALVAEHGSTVVTTAQLDPRLVHAFALGDLEQRLRDAVARLELGDSLVHARAPLGVLRDLDRRGDSSPTRNAEPRSRSTASRNSTAIATIRSSPSSRGRSRRSDCM